MSGAFYNEIDPLKAEILREAIADGAIAPGDVDERSIADVRGDDLRGYTQCHFFAGGGFWSLAARLAGWPDDEPLWSGSSPCPSFSAAGKGEGFDDPRHLWPDWARLIRECRPAVVVGEQADDAVGFGWLDLVQTDLEAQAYAVGKVVFGAHSVGAPHIRQRLYFCADAGYGDEPHGLEVGGAAGEAGGEVWEQRLRTEPGAGGVTGERADAEEFGGRTRLCDSQPGEQRRLIATDHSGAERDVDALGAGLQGHGGDEREWRGSGWLDPQQARSAAAAGATRGFWGDCDWWYGRDGLYRAIGPGLFPLAHGSPARVGRLRLYGDAIVVPQAAAFLKAYREARGIVQ